MRQRPGNAKAIFLTLEDEQAVANVIFWERTFNRYRPIVMGARLIRVTGKLQSESDVIHIVAEKVEDLTPWLSVLLQEKPDVPVVQNDRQDIATLSGKAERVMPKGRNFQ